MPRKNKFGKKLQPTPAQMALAELLRDKKQARQRVKAVIRLSLTDGNLWEFNGRGRVSKLTFLQHLGFPPKMSTTRVSFYWHALTKQGVIFDFCAYKPILVLEALGYDPPTWFKLQITSGLGVRTMARKLTQMVRESGGLVVVNESSIKRALSKIPMLPLERKRTFLDLAESNPQEATNRLIQAMKLALRNPKSWHPNSGNLMKRPFLEHLGFIGYRSYSTYGLLWGKVMATGLWDPIWTHKAVFALKALGYDPVEWVKEAGRQKKSVRVIAEEINGLLVEAGAVIIVGVDAVRDLKRLACQKR